MILEEIRLRPQRIDGISLVRDAQSDNSRGLCVLAGIAPTGRVYCWGRGAFSLTGSEHHEPWSLWRYPRQMGDIPDVRSFAGDASCIWADHGFWEYNLLNEEWRFIDISLKLSPPQRVMGVDAGIMWFEHGVLASDFASIYATHDFQPQEGIVMIDGDFGYACVLLDTGRVRCFGHNQAGQLGNGFDGSEACSETPTPDGGTRPTAPEPCMRRLTEIPELTEVVKISMTYDRGCALKRDGTVWCWGSDLPMRNGLSMLGYGGVPSEFCAPPGHPESAVPCRKHPTQVVGVTDAIDLAMGHQHACVVRRTGAVACWGNNNRGQLGDWTLTDRATPVTVRWH